MVLHSKYQNQIHCSLHNIKYCEKYNARKIETHTDKYTVTFGQPSPEKPNLGKLVQQLRVLILCSSNLSKNRWMPKLVIQYREILTKELVRKSHTIMGNSTLICTGEELSCVVSAQ